MRNPASSRLSQNQASHRVIFLVICLLLAHTVAAAETPVQTQPAPMRRAQLSAGELDLRLRQNPDGVQVESLFDNKTRQEFLTTNTLPLFTLVLRHRATQAERRLTADQGWAETDLRHAHNRLEAHWRQSAGSTFAGLAAKAGVSAQPKAHAFSWKLSVQNQSPVWSIQRVIFPQVALADLGPDAAVLFPRGPGEVQRNVWTRSFNYHGNYPGGWCAMQWMAAYREAPLPTGLYVAVHDPWGSTKDLGLKSEPATRRLESRFEHPVANMGTASNNFTLSGTAVWRLFRGDWFDAAQIYKAWVRDEARWWPRLSPEGRRDTPRWMRELHAWAMTGGAPEDCVPRVKAFQSYLGVPVGFHWYNWHQIPFDNDYPHYFPAKTNFAQGVRELEQSQVHVMPYINGRLWDAKDRGADDLQFSTIAQPAATKDAAGKPFLESYGSKETNGQPVRLAVMCPTTPLWRQTVRETVSRLMRECGTGAVYIDQVAAAPPVLCLDPTHGHPLGGGHWWNQGYWNMLDAIRRTMPREAMLTTECNGEPFIRWFDGYLTWHWQHDGQVPAFPAIYGGAIQMFGRAYRGGATKDLALRMKAAQQLVFGEQIGWIDPNLVKEPENAEFFRQTVRLRSRLHRYFYAGEMARPPRLEGDIPTVKADWQWSGQWWVTTPALLSGAWRIPREKSLTIIFANTSHKPVTATVRVDPSSYGTGAKELRATPVTSAAAQETETWPAPIERALTFPARTALAWELRWR